MTTNLDYKQAGVDIEAGYEAVRLMKPFTERTRIPGVLAGLGGFGGCFELPKNYREPVLVSGTDSVGTKLKIAYETGVHNTVGIDCVAMCVNDIICAGAKPLFFLDYIGIGRLDPKTAASLVEGVCEGCVQAGCALVGGETAELPGIYKDGEYDLVGFAVGVVEKSKMITGDSVSPGDSIIGIASSGLHSNGFSLARKIALGEGRTTDTYIPEVNKTIGEEFLTPTKIYAKLLNGLAERFEIKGAANITGGGWIENIARIAGGKEGLAIELDAKAAPVPAIFELLREWGGVSPLSMYNTFNMGIGMTLAIDSLKTGEIIDAINEAGERAYLIGKVAANDTDGETVRILGL